MSVYDLGQYGKIDTISPGELLPRLGGIAETAANPRQSANLRPGRSKIVFLADGFDPSEEAQYARLERTKKPEKLDTIVERGFEIANWCIAYRVRYPCRLVSLYRSQDRGFLFPVRVHEHTYFDGKREEIAGAMQRAAAAAGGHAPDIPQDFGCMSFDVFLHHLGYEDPQSLGTLTCASGAGPGRDIAEVYNIRVFEQFMGIGIGSALEASMTGELSNTGHRLVTAVNVATEAAGWYERRGYGFFQFSDSGYRKPQIPEDGIAMAKVLDDSIIVGESGGGLRWPRERIQAL